MTDHMVMELSNGGAPPQTPRPGGAIDMTDQMVMELSNGGAPPKPTGQAER